MLRKITHSLDLTSADKFTCVSKIPRIVFLNPEKVLKQTTVHCDIFNTCVNEVLDIYILKAW